MTSWHKWTEHKPAEADELHGLIEFGRVGKWRMLALASYAWGDHPPDYWRTPTPLPGEESGPAVADVDDTIAHMLGLNPPSREGATPAAAGSDAWWLQPGRLEQKERTNAIAEADAYWLRYYVGQAMVFGAGGTPEDVAAHALKDALAALAAVKAQEANDAG